MAQINRSPVQQRIARGIAIRKRIARGSPSRAAVAAAAASAVEAKPIVVILVDGFGCKSSFTTADVHVFEDIEAMRVGLNLDDVKGIAHEIDEENVDGTVYATIDPYAEEIQSSRKLIIASNLGELVQRNDVACDEI